MFNPITAAGQVMTFNQTWEGEIFFTYTGTGLAADWAPVVAGGKATVSTQIVNNGTTKVVGSVIVSAVPGTTLTPTMTATTVTAAGFVFGSCGYTQAILP